MKCLFSIKLQGWRWMLLPLLIKCYSWLQVTWKWAITWLKRRIDGDVVAKVALPATTAIVVITRWRIWEDTWRTSAANSQCISAPTVRTERLISRIFKCTWWNTLSTASYLAWPLLNIRIHESPLDACLLSNVDFLLAWVPKLLIRISKIARFLWFVVQYEHER